MEPMQCEETTRNAILEQLKRRELFVTNAQDLPLEELQQIYEGFIVPQPRRERRRFVANVTTKSINEMPMQMESLIKGIKVVHVVGEKRSGNVEEPLESCAPKRLRNQEL